MKFFQLYPHIKKTSGDRGTLLFDYVSNNLIRLSGIQEKICNDLFLEFQELVELYPNNEVYDLIKTLKSNQIGTFSGINYPKPENYYKRKVNSIEICEIEIIDDKIDFYIDIINKCRKGGCKTFVLLFYSLKDFRSAEDLINKINLSVNVKLLKLVDLLDLENYNELINHEKIFRVHLENQVPENFRSFNRKIFWMNDTKKIAPYEAVFNRSLIGNPYFFGRIYIDNKGFYSSGYKQELPLGNFLIESIEKIIETLLSKGLWKVKKNQIVECKSCEFRDICIDNSDLIKEEDGSNFKLVEKCSYAPILSQD